MSAQIIVLADYRPAPAPNPFRPVAWTVALWLVLGAVVLAWCAA